MTRADYDKSIELAPERTWGHVGRAHVFKHMRKYDDSIAAFRKAPEIDPRDSVTQIELGERAKAIADYEKALSLGEGLADYMQSDADFARDINDARERLAK